MKRLSVFLPIVSVTVLGGCAQFKPETWTNRGPATMEASDTGLLYCHEDANIIDGERMVGTLCSALTSGFFMHGEPEIKFGPWNRKFMSALASETTKGIERDYEGKRVFLKCTPVLGGSSRTEIGRDCSVSVDEQHLVSAKFIFKKEGS
ncbi:hypothetical protein LNN38_07620 [Pseudomonas sp. LA21]|uniref:hypothetical protein n=1 Tax=unclassified Pseudomonas TaxID=196821 RepID=UPI001FB7FE86|nr:hypothetical protein [Pseudomonas sp. LA21]MCJ1884711.1 hypothetical protein [Pseudomonas sp. LA21]